MTTRFSVFSIIAVCTAVLLPGCSTPSLVYPGPETQIPTSAPMMTDSPGKTGTVAVNSVFRIVCPKKNSGGSAFLHKSGRVITAAHIVAGCKPKDVFLITAKGKKIGIKKITGNIDLDLALLTPAKQIQAKTLPISTASQFTIGSQVSIWGYPTGYTSGTALLGVGYLAGEDTVASPTGKMMKRWVVNAAINLGNSGGPLVDVETGEVIGVVSSKLAPMPKYIETALASLKRDKTIIAFKKIKTDGSEETMSTSQVLEEVLQHLRSQTQLVIGHTVVLGDLRALLKANGLEP